MLKFGHPFNYIVMVDSVDPDLTAEKSGPSCSKLTMSLINDSLKFTSSDTQICCNFLLKKCESLLTFFQQKISEYCTCILNPLKQLTK